MRILRPFVLAVLISAYAHSADSPSVFYCLGELSDRYPVEYVLDELRVAEITVVEASDRLVLFGVHEKSHLTPFVRRLDFLNALYIDAQSTALPESIRETAIAFRFQQLCASRSLASGTDIVAVRSLWSGVLLKRGLARQDTRLPRVASVSGIDAVLGPAGLISGRVTNAAGTPLSASVRAYDATSQYLSYGYLQSAYTDTNGNYTIGGLPSGSYKVYFRPTSGNYLAEWYDDKSVFDSATPVSVTAGTTTSNINAILSPGGIITGNVVDTAGLPVKSATVYAYDATVQTSVASTSTDTQGSYSIQGLPTGAYKVYFKPSTNHLPEWYSDKNSYQDASPISVIAGATTPNINAILSPGGIISGHVVDASGAGLKSISVLAYPTSTQVSTRSTSTDASGNYAVEGLATGSYKVFFSPPTSMNYLSEWYDDKADFNSASPVAVTAGSTTPNINATLAPGGIIAGRVTNAAGSGLQYVDVWIYDATKSYARYSYVRWLYTDVDGNYAAAGLRSGNYKVFFQPYSFIGNYLAEWYDDRGSFDSATQVGVTAGSTTSNVNAILGPGQTISGRVTDSAGKPVYSCWVYVYDLANTYSNSSYTGSDGDYVCQGLASGAYKVSFNPYTPTLLSEWYNDKRTFDTADIVYLGSFLQITSPNGREVWGIGSTHNITWISSGLTGNLTLALYRSGTLVREIGTVNVALGSYTWTVPDGLTPSADYKVRGSLGSYDDFSDANFTITQGWITLLIPNGGERWSRGKTQNITWEYQGLSGQVSISLYKGGSYLGWIGSAAVGTRLFAWPIPANHAVGNDFKVRVAVYTQFTIEDYSDANFSITSGVVKEDLVGSWPGSGTYSRNSDTGAWSYLSSPASQVATGDVDADGIDDIVGTWSGSGVWVRYSANGRWAFLSSQASWIALGDVNGDRRADLVGIWNSVIWVLDSATGAWSSISSGATQVAAGDVDGDGRADIIGLWPDTGVWVRNSASGQWSYLGSPASWIASGDMNGDGKADLLGIWNSQVWVRDSVTGVWSSPSSGAVQVAAGDLDGDGKDDLLGIWPTGVWVQQSSDGSWQMLSSPASSIAAGRLR